jgi:hypothetical protein
MTVLISSFAGYNYEWSLEKKLDVQPERPAVYVF